MNIDNFLKTLPFMLKGMAGIGLVTLVLIISIIILNKATKTKKEQ